MSVWHRMILLCLPPTCCVVLLILMKNAVPLLCLYAYLGLYMRCQITSDLDKLQSERNLIEAALRKQLSDDKRKMIGKNAIHRSKTDNL